MGSAEARTSVTPRAWIVAATEVLVDQGTVYGVLGFSMLEARSRAFPAYTCVVGVSLLATQRSAEQKAERARFVERLM
jgi:hypothetical protein